MQRLSNYNFIYIIFIDNYFNTNNIFINKYFNINNIKTFSEVILKIDFSSLAYNA